MPIQKCRIPKWLRFGSIAVLPWLLQGPPLFAKVVKDTLLPSQSMPLRTDCRCAEGRETPPFEPSGIVWDGGDWLYAVSDGGMIARRATKAQDHETWVCLYKWCGDADQDPRGKAENDFESVAFVPSPAAAPRFIWVGVEGTEYSVADPNDPKKKIGRRLRPQIKQFDTLVGQFAGGLLSLGGIPFGAGNGVESMTFVPDPSAGVQRGLSKLGGYFIASSQFHDEGQPGGKVYIFHADTPPVQDPQGEWSTPPSGQPFFLPDAKGGGRTHKSSDFYYSPDSCALYVTYDDESDAWTLDPDGGALLTTGSQSLWIYTAKETTFPLLTAETSPAPFLFSSEHKLPASRGVEGVTAVTTSADLVTLYTAIDMSAGQNPGATPLGPGTHFNSKDEIKAAKGSPLPSTIDRYTPLERTLSPFCPCRQIPRCSQLATTTEPQCGWCAEAFGAYTGSEFGPQAFACQGWTWRTQLDKCPLF